MSLHKQKITLRVTSQTAYHIRQTADRLGMTEGQVIDALVSASRKGGRRISELCYLQREKTKEYAKTIRSEERER